MRIVVIGNGTAGQTASAVAKKQNPRAEVIVLEKRPYPAYHPCSLPYVLTGKVNLDDVVVKRTFGKAEVVTRAKVESIDPSRKRVSYERDGDRVELDYDVLLLATGMSPIVPRVPGSDLGGVRKFWTIEDVRYIMDRDPQRVIIVGGSATGIEVAAELASSGKGVTIVEMMEQLMPGKIDPPISSLAMKALTSMGVRVMLKHPLQEITGRSGEVEAAIAGQVELEADTVILTTGARPETELVKDSGLLIGDNGGIVVDQWMRTSLADVYAAGDVAEVPDFVTGKRVLTGLASTALVQGRIAGMNAVGGDERYRGTLTPFVVHAGAFGMGCTGLTSSRAEKEGIEHLVGRFRGLDMAKEVPGHGSVVTWLICDPAGRLLGGQVFGKMGIRERIIFLALGIRKGLDLRELESTEFAYHPMMSPVTEPLVVLANALRRKYGL